MLHVNINNPGAIHLYQQLGFVIVGRRGKFRK
jgi:ribosomal protein S18 acetylase RimI-like enzyme